MVVGRYVGTSVPTKLGSLLSFGEMFGVFKQSKLQALKVRDR